jgi:Putative peptidoglycan binding domain/D-alanyl-D-alanine carboxypeptidase
MRVLRTGMKGADVRKWQLFLIGQGLPLPTADSIFGGQTFNATVAFQHQYGLDADGVVGHQTLVGIANDHGFYWGGHYSKRLDGMHFEVAQLRP